MLCLCRRMGQIHKQAALSMGHCWANERSACAVYLFILPLPLRDAGTAPNIRGVVVHNLSCQVQALRYAAARSHAQCQGPALM